MATQDDDKPKSMRRTLEQQKADIEAHRLLDQQKADRRYARQSLTLNARASLEGAKAALREDAYQRAIDEAGALIEHLVKLREVHNAELQAKFVNVTSLPVVAAPSKAATK